jgi:hypothetical protein
MAAVRNKHRTGSQVCNTPHLYLSKLSFFIGILLGGFVTELWYFRRKLKCDVLDAPLELVGTSQPLRRQSPSHAHRAKQAPLAHGPG